MGQISFRGQKPKYCNLVAITTGSKKDVVLGDGEVWLVDSTNASKVDGRGLYDSYIKGDGTTAAKNLTVHKIDNIPATDPVPTEGSSNPVSSGGVYNALQNVDIDVDSALSENSENPVENRVITEALDGKQDTITDLATIRSGAALGATAMQSASLGELTNVSSGVDVVNLNSGEVLYKQPNSDTWTVLALGDLSVLLEPISYAVRVNDQMGTTTLNFYKTSSTANIQVLVSSKSRDNQIPGAEWTDTGEQVTLYVEKRDSTGQWSTEVSMIVNTDEVITVNIRSALTAGNNLLRFHATGVTTEVTSPFLIYNVELLVISPTVSLDNLAWTTPLMGDLVIPLNYTGEMNKTVHIDVLDEDGDSIYDDPYEEVVGMSTQTGSARDFTLGHPVESGVYTVMAWVTTDDPEVFSNTAGKQFLWLADGAVGKWLVINSLAQELTNWTDNTVMQYFLYDTSGTTSSLQFTLTKDGSTIYTSSQTSVERGLNSLVIPLEIDSAITRFNVVLTATDIPAEGETAVTFGTWTLPVENSVNYAAVSGAVFQLNPKTRTNADSNRDKVINAVTGQEVPTTLTGITFSAADMWTTDSNGERCMQVNAGQRVVIGFNPFETNVAQGTGVCIEVDFKTDNVSDYSAVCVDMSNDYQNSFVGLRIGPSRMLLCTQATNSEEEQELVIDDGVRMRSAVTVIPRAYTFQNTAGTTNYLNLVRYYIDGKINRVFEIQNTDVLQTTGGIVIGSDDCDVTIYNLRVYRAKLDPANVHQNYINFLSTNALKAEEKTFNDVYDNGELSFNKVREKGINCFVADKPFRSLKVDSEYDLGGPSDRRDVTLELYILSAIYNYIKANPIRQGGQGTSSMRYWEWNQRLRTLSATTIIYGVNEEIIDTTTHVIDIWSHVPKVADITMKKNWASSMQDHKLGSVNTLTDLWKAMGYSNAASDEDEKVRISVYQEPFVGWYKKVLMDDSIKYVCMGDFTGGPHKGDKKCFGYNLSEFPQLMSMEGCNNDPVLTNFKMPWDSEHVMVDTSDDILVMYRTGYDASGNAQWTKAWEQDFGSIEGGDSNAVAMEKLESFIDAYNDIYRYNPYIAPWEGTVAALNAAAAQWAASYRNGDMSSAVYTTKITTEYWLTAADAVAGASQYDLYCFDPSTQTFYPSTIDGVVQNVGEYLA